MFTILSALSLMFCVVAALVSFEEAFAITWKGESVGASEGVALWRHLARRNRPLSVLHAPAPKDGGKIPGPNAIRLTDCRLFSPDLRFFFSSRNQ
jgi:hypothetical protein